MTNIVGIGLDLAWSARNNTGIAALRWDGQCASLIEARNVGSDDDIINAVKQLIGANQPVVVAIDAPLTVPNLEGRRPGDAEVHRVFGRFHAGAYPCNRRLLATHHGEVRGEVIARRLAHELNIQHRATIDPRQPTRQAFEAFPHPAMITLFGLDRTLKYKAKAGRSLPARLTAFREYQRLIREKLGKGEPKLEIDEKLVHLLEERHLIAGGLTTLKRYEDRLDAILCAYISLYYWYWGLQRCRIFGNEEEGYIIAPVDDRTREP
ncbi:MAG: DUF429 domain-containing protein [Anaerolineae bacterium]|nr:DUF429 domain-containing protein [Anaerolineae bacterium]